MPINASDPDCPNGSCLTLSWTANPSVAFGAFVDNHNGTGGLTFTPGYDDAGTYAVTVSVSDGIAPPVSGNFTLVVNNISPPPPPPINYTLSVSKNGDSNGTITSNPAGINCGNDCSESYSSGLQVTLSAVPDDNTRFDGWSGACSGTEDCVLTMNSDKSADATFNTIETPPPPPPPPPPPTSYILTVSKSGVGQGTITSNPSGINCGSDCSENYRTDIQVALTATPDSNSTFEGWVGACSGGGVCNLSIVQNISVEARFNLVGSPPPPLPPPPPKPILENKPRLPVIDISKINEAVSNIGKSMKYISYFLGGIAVLVLVIALFY